MIGILADSHDNITKIRKAVSVFKSAGCGLVIHAGDIIAPFAAKELGAVGCPVKAVFGNCDGERDGLKDMIRAFGEIQDAPAVFDWDGRHFFLAHLEDRVDIHLDGQAYDVIIFGHTHKPEIRRRGKTLLINPGETGGWLSGRGTAALLDPAAGKAEIVGLD